MLRNQSPNLQLFLDRLTCRSALSEQEQEAILSLPGQAMIIAPGNDFIRLGDKVEHTCLIAHGLVARFDQTSDGRRQFTALHIKGDMPDLSAAVQPAATCALQTLSSATIVRVPHTALRDAAATHPGIAQALWRDTVVDSMILVQWVLNVGQRSAKTRIAHLLCEMAIRYRALPREGEVIFRLPMTQSQLADATGLSQVHVNRSLKALDGIGITFRNGTVRIADWETMAQLADFNGAYLQQPAALAAPR